MRTLFKYRYVLLWLTTIVWFSPIHAQIKEAKAQIDFDALDNWPSLGVPAVNNAGTYVAYITRTYNPMKRTLHISATNGPWSQEILGIRQYNFMPDNRHIIMLTENNEMCTIKLGSSVEKKNTGIKHYQLFESYNKNWLLYTDMSDNLYIQEIQTGKIMSYPNVISFRLENNGQLVYLETKVKSGQELSLIDLKTQKLKSLCTAPAFTNLTISPRGDQYAFSYGDNVTEIWIGSTTNTVLTKLTDSNIIGLDSDLKINTIDRFSKDGSQLFISLKESPTPPLPDDAVKVNVWSYKDAKIQSQQLAEINPKSYIAAINIASKVVKQLQHENEFIQFLNENYAIITVLKGSLMERNWNESAKGKYILLNLKSGTKDTVPFWPKAMSPDEKYLIGLDVTRFKDIMYYEIRTKKFAVLTHDLIKTAKATHDYYTDDKRTFDFYGWLEGQSSVLIVDEFDLWKVDLKMPEKIVNLTNGFGRRNHIMFRPIVEGSGDGILTTKSIAILSAYDVKTKRNGFYSLSFKENVDPKKCSMADCYYHSEIPILSPFYPMKAKDVNVWIVKRTNYNDPGNYYFTKNFISFKPFTNFHPENKYNWLTSELVNFKSLDGSEVQGVLYKPENFDASKKYPLIITYYEQLSDHLHSYPKPEYSAEISNIAYFVSNEYLMFTPDIPIRAGKQGESAYQTVVGAYKYLSQYSYIDSTKVGIEGHSFGGFETNNIIIRPNRFAAAVNSAGPSNLISYAGDVMSRGGEPFGRAFSETEQGRIGCNIWEGQDLYIESSAVMHADKINIPLLMLYNSQDDIVPFTQGRELFTALRRLQKRVWLLQYDNEGHMIANKNNLKDYTIRLKGFLDHYLKDAPMPAWMQNGISAKYKGYRKGY
ncbi:prolyl oligopeptidase family serine peptidase [Chitinophaga oryziterrae]|uniref:Prolyl oligopeptidase family serine peptidase n=1 Tax=Chitinophaga oryziterrae TaxID=1031224 RepID=A0A6N8J4M2_9BACT|nr:prolyl oligopeptidase family serine peptidase [Chitinophaga oryziterrae]MVT40195.1 prolyl oligopeptidase family serine peptidase [Chitinophaga oryziterrae]